MRILLTLPRDPSFDVTALDLGLGYLAAILRRDGHHVELCLSQELVGSETSVRDLVARGAFDVIGVKVISSSIRPATRLLSLLKESAPAATLVVGGPHVSCDASNAFRFLPQADYAFHAEAEVGLPALLRQLPASDEVLGRIPNLVWRKGTETIVNPPTFVESLDDLPFPAWDLMDPRTFPHVPFNGYSRRYPIAPIILTRGCPMRCTFCGAAHCNGRHLRTRSAANVLAEIRFLIDRFGVRELQFWDSNCADPHGPLRELLSRMIADGIDVTWCAPNGIRVGSVDEELPRLMKASGCFQVNVGIESGSPRILKQIKKGITPALVREKVALLRRAGIEVVGFFMIGFPGETAAEIEETISFALDLPLTAASFSILSPLPGTEIYEALYGTTPMEIEALESLDFIHYRNSLSEVSWERLREIQKRAYLRFHLRPRVLAHFVKNLTSARKLRHISHRIGKLILAH